MKTTANEVQKKVISLIRVSTEEQAKGDRTGIPRQRAAIAAGVRAHDLTVIREVVVIDVSGRHVKDDPQFQQIFRDLISGAADGIIVAEFSRLVRPELTGDIGDILDYFMKYKRLIFTPSDKIDMNSKHGWYTGIIGAMISGDELKTIRDRLDGGKATKRLEGKHPGGPQHLSRGVRYVRKRNDNGKIIAEYWELDGIDSERVLRAYSYLDDGDSYQTIAKKVGGGWTGKGIRETLMNPIWKGVRRYSWEAKGEEYTPIGKDGTPRKKRRKLTRREQPLELAIDLPPLVSEAVWNRAQEIIAQRKLGWRKTKKPPRFLCASLLRCACGRNMYLRCGSRGHGKDVYYCASRFPKGPGCGAPNIYREDLDRTVEQIITTHLLDTKFLMAVFHGLQQPPQEDPNRAEREQSLAKVRESITRLTDLHLNEGMFSKEEFKTRYAALQREERQLLASLPTPPAPVDPRPFVKTMILAFANFGALSFDCKRNILQRAVREIIISGSMIPRLTFKGGFFGGHIGETPVVESVSQTSIEKAKTASASESRVLTPANLELHVTLPFQISRGQSHDSNGVTGSPFVCSSSVQIADIPLQFPQAIEIARAVK